MGHLGIEKASVMGYSSGAVVALQTAIRHPRLVDNLIAISTAFRSDGYYPEVLEVFAQMPPAGPMIAAEVSRTPLASLYPSVNWETMFRKTGELANRSYDWSASVSRSRRRRCSCLRMPTASALNTSRSSTNCWAADNATPASTDR